MPAGPSARFRLSLLRRCLSAASRVRAILVTSSCNVPPGISAFVGSVDVLSQSAWRSELPLAVETETVIVHQASVS